jgi:hypothetical protein
MGTLFANDGTTKEVTPKNGKNFTFEEIKELTGVRWIEAVWFKDGTAIMFDEEYLVRPEPSFNVNKAATDHIRKHSPNTLVSAQGIMGGALLLTKEEVRADMDDEADMDNEAEV